MQRNLNAIGRAVRLISGLVLVLIALVLLTLSLLGVLPGRWAWVTALVLAAIGGFQIYEGWCSWCALRAMGFRTPI